MKEYSLIFCLVTISFATGFSTKLFAQDADEIAVRKLLDNQAKAWSKGSIEEFMQGYWRSDSLTFTGKNGVTYGYKTTLKNYRKNYPNTAAMGKLHFDLLQVKKLSSKYFYVIGKWHLKRTAGDIGGYFTLLFKKINKRWFIISDHTS